MIFEKNSAQNMLHRKHVLFDTNVLIRTLEKRAAAEDLFSLIQASEAIPVYFSFIKFEFVREAKNTEHRKIREAFFENYDFMSMPARHSDDQISEDALNISNIYASKNHHGASLVDCLIAAFLKRHKHDLILATMNLDDFPTFLLALD